MVRVITLSFVALFGFMSFGPWVFAEEQEQAAAVTTNSIQEKSVELKKAPGQGKSGKAHLKPSHGSKIGLHKEKKDCRYKSAAEREALRKKEAEKKAADKAIKKEPKSVKEKKTKEEKAVATGGLGQSVNQATSSSVGK